MAILKVARMGHPVLREGAREVNPAKLNQPDFQHLVEDMIETMAEYSGVGLAGPQVHVPLRIFIFLKDTKDAATVLVAINPLISAGRGKKENRLGGMPQRSGYVWAGSPKCFCSPRSDRYDGKPV